MKLYKFVLLSIVLSNMQAFGSDYKRTIPVDSVLIMKQLEEVKVYSQRKTEDLQNVPVSISALLPNKIERDGIVSVKDFTSRIPNFYMPEYGNKVNSPIYIRGIGSKFNTPSVAFYVDYVPYFDKSTYDFELFDISSVEVFRGPQGTLFGRNSMAGVVSIFTKEASTAMQNRISASFGSYSYMNLLATHSKTYGKLGVNTGVSYKKRDGFFKNTLTGKDVDYVDGFDGKINLSYKFSSSFNIKFVGAISLNNDGGNPYQVYNVDSGKFDDVAFDEESYYTRNLISGAVIISKKIGDFELRNVSSYQYFQDHQHLDQDYTVEDIYKSNFYQYQHLITNELAFITPQIGKWSSQSGLFFFNQLMDKGIGIENGDEVYKYMGGKPMASRNIPGASNLTRTGENDFGFALFHQSQFSFTKKLILSLGVRLDYEQKYFKYTNTTKLPNPIVIPGMPPIALPPTMPNPIISNKDIPDDKFVFLPKATLSYLIKEQNVYASWGIGYKSGGFNTSYDKNNPHTITYNPEYAENFEVGFKTRWLNNRFTLNASLFYTDWKDQQISVFLPNGQGLMITNAGHSFSKGFEIEASAIPIVNFQVYASYGNVKAKFLDYNMGSNAVYDGNYLPYVPRSTFNVGASYRIPFGQKASSALTFGLDFCRMGKMYYNDANAFVKFKNALAYQTSALNLNGFIGFIYNDLELNLRCKNLTNEDNNVYVFEYEAEKFLNLFTQKVRPLQLYVELNYRF